MRGSGILAAGAVVLALAAGGPVGAETVEVSPGPPVAAETTISPKALPKREPAPAALAFELRVEQALDGSVHPLKEIAIKLDRNVVLDFRRYPLCGPSSLDDRTLADFRERCREAIVGAGAIDFEIRFPESQTVAVRSRMIVVHGDREGDVRRLYAIAEVKIPVPAMIVMTIEIRPIHNGGRYARQATISIPKVAGGSGAITQLRFQLGRKFIRDGNQVSTVRARCPDGKLQSQVDLLFAEGGSYGISEVRPCTGMAS